MSVVSRYILVVTLYLFSSTNCGFGRTDQLDSLNRSLQKSGLTEQQRALIHLEIGRQYLLSNPTKALSEVKEILNLTEMSDPVHVEALGIIGQVHYTFGDYFKGLTYHLQRLDR